MGYDSTQNRHNAIRIAYQEILDEIKSTAAGSAAVSAISNKKLAALVAERTGFSYSATFVYKIIFCSPRKKKGKKVE